MLVEFTIDGSDPICAPYDDCIDVVLAARENGKTVTVVEITLEQYNAYRKHNAIDPRD